MASDGEQIERVCELILEADTLEEMLQDFHHNGVIKSMYFLQTLARAYAENVELRAWKKLSIEIEKEWDMHDIPLGKDCRKALAEFVRKHHQNELASPLKLIDQENKMTDAPVIDKLLPLLTEAHERGIRECDEWKKVLTALEEKLFSS